MVIQSLFNHNFLSKPEECDILTELSPSSRKIIALEVEQNLSSRLMSTISDTTDEATKKSPLNLPMLLEPKEAVDWKLPTWQHCRWTMHALAPIFGLSLDSLPSISNAVKIYCLWLKAPSFRPSCISEENELQFVSTILLDLSELFVARKLVDSKTISVATAKRHAELCNTVIKTITNDFIPNSPLLKEKASVAWNMLTSLILGISDDLLWRDAQNYLADDLTESLLMACFICLLKSSIYNATLWNKVGECFRLWCHRVRVVLVWGSVIIPVTHAVATALHSKSNLNSRFMIGLHSSSPIEIENEYLMFCWSKLSKLLPKLSSMSSEIFLRSAQTIEKVIAIWLTCPSVPDINTFLALYGDYLFELYASDKPGFDTGRAILISSLCKILALRQQRTAVDGKLLGISYLCLQKALACDGGVLDSVLSAIESVLLSNQPGVRSLIPSVFEACRRIVRRYVGSKPSVSENIRLCCYRLLNFIGLHFRTDLISVKLSFKADLMTGLYSEKFFEGASDLPQGQLLLRMVVDTLVTAMTAEESLLNIRFLLNSVISLARFDSALLPVFAKILEETLYSEKLNIETLLTTVRCLEQLASLGNYSAELVKRICLSLMTLADSLFTKNQLTQSYFLLIAIYEASFSWLNTMDRFDSDCVANNLATLTKFLASSEKPGSRNKKATVDTLSTSSTNHRKSLNSRVFNAEGKEDDIQINSLSPSTQQKITDSFAEYTSSMIVRMLALLFDDLVRDGSLTQVDSCDEFMAHNDFKYFTLSSSIIIGYCDEAIIIRNAARKFSWKVNFFSPTLKSNFSAALHAAEAQQIDLLAKSEVDVFSRDLVVEESILKDDSVLLNDELWNHSIYARPHHRQEIQDMVDKSISHLNSMLSELPKKATQITPQQGYKPASPMQAFTILSHLGLTHPATRSILIPITQSDDFVSELKRLDAMSFKLEFTIPIEYRDNRSSNPNFSNGFNNFVNCLRMHRHSYVQHSVKVDFSINSPCPEASISVIWSENGESVDKLPSLIPTDASAFVYLVICPVLIGDSMKGHFYQVRILLSKTAPAETESFQKYSNIFGPVFDGMVVAANDLSSHVRDTIISAHLFVLRFIQNKPNPVMNRAAWIRAIVFKNFQPLSLSDFYSNLLH